MKIKLALHWQMAIALILGGICGWLFGDSINVWDKYIDGISQLFLRSLNMVVLPLVFLSCVLSFSSMLEVKSMGKIAAKTFIYFIFTGILAAVIGIVFPSICRVGVGTPIPDTSMESAMLTPEQLAVAENMACKTWIDYIVDIIPSNVFEAFSNDKMLPVVFFALIMGLFATKISSPHQQSIQEIFTSFNEVIIRIATFIIHFAPIGIFAIVMLAVGKNAELMLDFLKKILFFVLAVWGALIIMGGLVLPTMVSYWGQISPIQHFKNISSSLFVAFSTCSSYGALPLMLSETENKCGVPTSIAGFTIPLGITFNKVGTIIYDCVAVVFVAQASEVSLTIAQLISLVGISFITVVGSPAMPMAGALVLAAILKAMNLPDVYIQLFLAVDILCDMPKTLLNAYSSCCGAMIVARSEVAPTELLTRNHIISR